MAKFENNLSKGNVVKQLIMFSLPLLASNIIQALYNVVDMLIVGRFSAEGMATINLSGVNIGGQATFMLTTLVIGLSVGATVLIGQYLGANDRQALKETIGTLFSSLTVLALFFTVAMLIFADPLLRLIQTPEESFQAAKDYLFVTTIGIIFIFIYNALSAVMRGMGDSKNPMIFVGIACGANVVLDLLFVAVFKLGAMGAAIATVISQALSVILCIIYLNKNDFVFKFNLQAFGFNKERLKLLIKVGVPSSIQNFAVTVSFLFLTAFVNTVGGVDASAAVGIVGKFNGFAILPGVAMSAAISAMAAQNFGAGELERAKQTMKTGIMIAMGISIPMFILVQLFPEAILQLFDDDPKMIAAGVEYLRTFSLDYLVVPIQFCLNGLFIGSGHTTFSLINGLMSSILIRIPASFLLGILANLGLMGIGLGAPLASLAAMILGIVFFFSGKWTKSTIINGEAPTVLE